ncbi:MAG: TIGR01777 family oxidoreductase [Solirubrobacterales bacterium]|nr:TIGR01777 family oxidoreductase [Solirubrobacterales bacterium]
MKILVTGASGTIGRAVCTALTARGDQVVALSRNPEKARQAEPKVNWHAWNPALERPPEEAFDGVGGVINLVGEPINQRWTDEAKRRILESRETATRNLVAAMIAAPKPPAVLVSQSAVGYYGDRGDQVVDESVGAGSSFDAQVCVAWEAAAEEAAKGGIRLAIMRTGLLLTRDAGLLGELLLPFRLGVGGPVAGGRNYMPWISLADEVGLLLWALDNESASGVYNATAPNPVTNREFSKALGRALHRPAVVPVPKLALKLRLGSELGEVAAGGQRAIPRRAQDQGYRFRFSEIDAALADALA